MQCNCVGITKISFFLFVYQIICIHSYAEYFFVLTNTFISPPLTPNRCMQNVSPAFTVSSYYVLTGASHCITSNFRNVIIGLWCVCVCGCFFSWSKGRMWRIKERQLLKVAYTIPVNLPVCQLFWFMLNCCTRWVHIKNSFSKH